MIGRLGRFAVLVVLCCVCGRLFGAEAAKPDANALLDQQRLILDDILGIEPSNNVCLIDPHQIVNAADLPGRLVLLSENPGIPAETQRYCFRVKGAKIMTQADQMQPVRCTKVEGTKVSSASLLSWIGRKVEATDIAEIRTTPLPASSISVDDLDEQQIQSRLEGVSPEGRRRMGIILSVIPYEAYASVCRQVGNTTDVGIWYIRVGKSWYAKNSDEVRRYYLVAVYAPVAFYDDKGLFGGMKIFGDLPETPKWQPPTPGMKLSAQLQVWNRERGKTSVRSLPGKLISEQKIPL
jgi:hypothetical protein